MFKLSHGHHDEAAIHDFIEFGSNDTSEPRRHKYHVKKEGLEKKCRVADQWIHLPRAVAEAATLNSFRNKIDNLWNRDVIMYNPDIDIHTEMSRRNIRYVHIEEDDQLGDDEEEVN